MEPPLLPIWGIPKGFYLSLKSTRTVRLFYILLLCFLRVPIIPWNGPCSNNVLSYLMLPDALTALTSNGHLRSGSTIAFGVLFMQLSFVCLLGQDSDILFIPQFFQANQSKTVEYSVELLLSWMCPCQCLALSVKLGCSFWREFWNSVVISECAPTIVVQP